MIKNKFCISLLCLTIHIAANLVPHNKLAHFVKKQKKTSDRYKNKPLALISKASWMLGYGSVEKDDLYLLDRMPKSESEINKLIELYPIDETFSHERIRRWKQKEYKRSAVIKELKAYTAEQCNCNPSDAYRSMRDSAKIDDQHYFKIVLQNLHDLYIFTKTIE